MDALSGVVLEEEVRRRRGEGGVEAHEDEQLELPHLMARVRVAAHSDQLGDLRRTHLLLQHNAQLQTLSRVDFRKLFPTRMWSFRGSSGLTAPEFVKKHDSRLFRRSVAP